MPTSTGIMTATVATSSLLAIYLVTLVTWSIGVGVAASTLADSTIFATLTVDGETVLGVNEERLHALINLLNGSNTGIPNFNGIVYSVNNFMDEFRSIDLNNITEYEYDQLVILYNNLVDYVNNLSPAAGNLGGLARTLVAIRESRLNINFIQAADADLHNHLNVFFNAVMSIGRESILATRALESILAELDPIITALGEKFPPLA
jgi:hypothetical protein